MYNCGNQSYILSMTSKKRLFLSGAAAGPLFVIIFTIEGILRRGYNIVRDPVSSLSIGPYGWTQQLNFWAVGSLLLLFAYGVWLKMRKTPIKSFWGPFLLALAGVGLICAGFFTTDPLPGYPLDLPYHLLPQTTHGSLHNLVSALVFYGLPAASFVFTRYFFKTGERQWAIYSLLSGIGALVTFVFLAINITAIVNARQTTGLTQIAGLLERGMIVLIFQWTTALAIHMLKTSSSPLRSRP